MALWFFTSPDDTPWDRFNQAMTKALRTSSGRFQRAHHRTVGLGSPVKMSDVDGNIIRVPVEVRGGTRQYAVAFIHVTDLASGPVQSRIQDLARQCVQVAEPYAEAPPNKPIDTVLTYP